MKAEDTTAEYTTVEDTLSKKADRTAELMIFTLRVTLRVRRNQAQSQILNLDVYFSSAVVSLRDRPKDVLRV